MLADKQHHGVSVIELLVVLALVAILTALLVPVVGSVKMRAQRADGASTMRQIGMALNLYVGENNGRLPGPLWSNQEARKGTPRNGQLVNWLLPYFQAEDIQNGEIVSGFANRVLRNHAGNWTELCHYYMIHHPRAENGAWRTDVRLFGGHPAVPVTPMALAAVNLPTRQLILIDNDRKLVRIRDYPPGLPPPNSPLDPIFEKLNLRNGLFLDGSVQALPIND